MDSKIYASRCLTGLKKCCTNHDCITKAAISVLKKKKESELKAQLSDWRLRKKKIKYENTKQSQEPLQKAINKIARLLDENETCLARPFEESNNYDAGHIFSVGAHPSLRYHLWNIHKQSVKSNKYLGGEQVLMLQGIENRYGAKIREYVESLPARYPVLKLTIDEKIEKLKIANKIIKELEKGAEYTRDTINEIIGIY